MIYAEYCKQIEYVCRLIAYCTAVHNSAILDFMVTLQIQNLNLAFGDRDILKDVSFTLDGKSRAALAGANGCGKSTLLKVITGQLASDGMNISKTRGIHISYLPQSDIVLPHKTVYETAEEGYARFRETADEIERLRSEITQENYEAKLSLIDELERRLEDASYDRRQARIEQILQGLGFRRSDFSRVTSEFSGGYQMRIALARILVESPDILLLDEPTNYLDIEAITWLKNYLKNFPGGLMLVSHDIDFLDETVNVVYELFKGKLTRYSGNYSSYLKQREAEIEEIMHRYEEQQSEIEKTERFIERFRYKATKSRQVQSRITALEKMEIIEIPDHLKKLSFSFPPAPHSGNDVEIAEHLHKAYGDHVIFNDLSFIVRKKERLAIAGRNGTGKSTLLRILAHQDDSFSGTLRDGAGLKIGYYAQESEKTLNNANTVLGELEEVADTGDLPRLRNMLGSFLFHDDDVFKSVSVLSGGEKSRLALLKILLHPANLLLLDEPTNHLDINTKEMLLEAIKAYDGTVVFVSHDTHFIKNLATRILYLSDEEPVFFEGDYDYFSYKLEEKESRFLEREKAVKAGKSQEKKTVSSSDDHRSQKERRNQIQKLEMLALSYDELEAVIRKEEEVNPFLEVKAGRYSAESTYRPIDSSLDYLSKDDEDEKAGWMERAISVKESLYEHLRMQIETLNLSDKEKEAALIIASSLDSKGFLPQPLDQILPSRYEDVRESALKVVQSLDPAGVGASDYKESLKIQLKGLGLQKEDENNIESIITLCLCGSLWTVCARRNLYAGTGED